MVFALVQDFARKFECQRSSAPIQEKECSSAVAALDKYIYHFNWYKQAIRKQMRCK